MENSNRNTCDRQILNGKPLVSVALCTYNGAKYLKDQLTTISNQTYTNLEIVIVDDHSSDETVSIIKSHMENDTRIKLWINDSNVGVNKSFKIAIDECQGDFIAIADQDDLWAQEKIKIQMDLIGDSSLIYHDSLYIDENGIALGKSTTTHHRFVRGKCGINFLFFNCISGHTCLFRKKFYQQIPLFPNGIYYDWWLAFCASSIGKLDFSLQQLVQHRIHQKSVTRIDKGKYSRIDRIQQLNMFNQISSGQLKYRINQAILYYQNSINFQGRVRLALFLFKNIADFTYIRKFSWFSKIKWVFRETGF
ncbi:hypothetical protein GCM10023231_06150 [Olivibacter ginsenosidimutans]|uniref:Glycosyltransferase 2-like domain-containing protein n=1 Tax=Olivibacter ginsenosidimutans TaxID=1176537 RepID=A0ABP9AH27_9SPHI